MRLKGWISTKDSFVVDTVETLITGDPGLDRVHPFPAAGDGAVDAFPGQQQGAVDILRQHQAQQWLPEGFVIIQDRELVQCADNHFVAHRVLLRAGP